MSEAIHLLAAGEAFRGWSTAVTVCGEPVTSEADGTDDVEIDPHYCANCVREARRWVCPIMNQPPVEIPITCEVHSGPGRLVIRRDGERMVLDGHADECCALTLDYRAVVALFDTVAEWLG